VDGGGEQLVGASCKGKKKKRNTRWGEKRENRTHDEQVVEEKALI
jgi:hypothetical protein